MGWRLHRIWSTDWYRNPEQELERTLVAIQKADHDYKNGPKAEPQKITPIENTTPIKREEITQQDDASHRPSVPYKRVVLQILLGDSELHEMSAQQLFPSVYQVVVVESPIHKTELIHRIIEGAALKRSGSRIQTTVEKTLNYGVREKKIHQKGNFIWQAEMDKPEVRDRSELDATSKKFEFVSPEEISAAIQQEVERGFSLMEKDAVSNAAHALGFQRVTAQAKILFDNQLARMIQDGTPVSRNGLVSPG